MTEIANSGLGAGVTGLFGGTAIVATIVMVWDKIKMVFSSLSSLLVESYSLSGENYKIIIRYLLSSDKSGYHIVPFPSQHLNSVDMYVKSAKRTMSVPTMVMQTMRGVFFRNGWRIVLVKGETIGNVAANHPETLAGRPGTSVNHISFLRGSIKIEKLLKAAYDLDVENIKKKDGACLGLSRFFFRKHFGSSRKKKDRQPGMAEAVLAAESVRLSSFDLEQSLEEKLMYWNHSDIGMENYAKKAFDHLAFTDEINDLIKETERWKNSKDWFLDKRIPWRRGVLLAGDPGNGKSAFVKAMAQYLDVPLHVFDISSMDNMEFDQEWNRAIEDSPCIVLVEDIDAVFNGRNNILDKEGDSLSFDCFLNTLSGVGNSDGVLVFITTNDISKLDPAIGRIEKDRKGEEISSRPGRIDRVISMGSPDDKCRRKIALRILADWPGIAEKTVKDGKGDSGAQFQERCSKIALELFWGAKEESS